MDLRTWVFVANRKLTDVESAQVENALQDFLATWSSHGTPLKASAFCFEQAAIVVAADELVAKASGCSIDKITHLVQALGQQLNVDFFDRFNVLQKQTDEWNIVRFHPEFHAQCISASMVSLEEFNKKAGN
ncbi:MAG: hypothetical protein EBV23_05495 [Flavobacteriia bacterium]|jgi:hypothetical protein|nr:hypothetical protein [Flavobacteriia bacterium]